MQKLRCPKCGCWSQVKHMESNAPKKRTKPKPKPHNPDGLTPAQVGKGWRLLDRNEVKNRDVESREIEAFVGFPKRYWNSNGWIGHEPSITYRTRLTRAELRRLS